MPRNANRNTPVDGVDHDQNDSETDPEQRTQMPLKQSISDSLTGDPENISTPVSHRSLNTSAAMVSILECMTLQQSTHQSPQFDGKHLLLKDFLHEVSNGTVFVTDVTELRFIKAVLAKLKGVARESVRDKQSLVNHRMKQSETMSNYNDRFRPFKMASAFLEKIADCSETYRLS